MSQKVSADLQRRIDRFDKIASKLNCERPSPLVIKAKIDDNLYENLRFAVAMYMSRCLSGSDTFLNEVDLMEEFDRRLAEVKNRTNNGSLIPKRELNIYYNVVYRCYGDIFRSFNLRGLIGAFTALIHMRYKEGWASEEHLSRSFPSETPHSDAWVDDVPFGINMITPMFGDVERNNVKCFAPPPDFNDDWLKTFTEF